MLTFLLPWCVRISEYSHSSVCNACVSPGNGNWQWQNRCVILLDSMMIVCIQCVSVYGVRKSCIVRAAMHGPLVIRAGHLIISQSPGLMEKSEWWELYLPAVNETAGDRWCARMQAGLLSVWYDHQIPETRATATQQATADTSILERHPQWVIVSAKSCQSNCSKKRSLFYNESNMQGWFWHKSGLCLLS